MRTALVAVFLALAAPVFAAQAVWKWVDDKGVTHYSDRPVPGAVRMEVSVGSRWDSSQPQVAATPSSQNEPAQEGYRNFEIWKPGADETMVNTGGTVSVSIRVDPALQDRHSLVLYLDGRLVDSGVPNAQSYELTNVARGSHTLIAVINDGRGRRVQETAPITFHVRQESIARPPVGPASRPPPKPRSGAANKLPSSQPSYADLHGQRAPIDPQTNAPVRKAPTPAGPKQGN